MLFSDRIGPALTKICEGQAQVAQTQMGVSPISKCLRKIGLEFESAVEIADRLLGVAARHISRAPIVIGISVAGSQLDRLTVISNRVRRFTFPVRGLAPVVVRFGVVQLQSNCLFVIGNRPVIVLDFRIAIPAPQISFRGVQRAGRYDRLNRGLRAASRQNTGTKATNISHNSFTR